MSGFYGGARGASFEIKKSYSSYDSLVQSANNGDALGVDQLKLGDWVCIDYPSTAGFNVFLGYHGSLWQVCSTIDYPDWEDLEGSIKIGNDDIYLFFRLINKGFGLGFSGESIRVATGGNAHTVAETLLNKEV